ncbi:MAG TPA: gamma-glutamyltransferase [Beijerinckiaceae bacterium]
MATTNVFDARMFPEETEAKPNGGRAGFQPPRFTARPEIRGSFGAIATSHWLATTVGMSLLERGGNAFDAAAAAAFVLQIALPEFNGIGGEAVLLILPRGRSCPRVVCGQGVAPGAADAAAFQELGLDAVPERGLLAATTPGAFDAWMLLLRDYGRMALRDVLSPAIAYAEEGTPTTLLFQHQLKRMKPFFEAEWPSTAKALPERLPDADGIGNRNAALAKTLLRLLDEAESAGADRDRQIETAREVFRRGFVAGEIERLCRTPHAAALGQDRHAALMRGEDLASWSASYEEPVVLRYGRYEVAKAGPWTQGPVFLQHLALLGQLDVGGLAADDPLFIHSVIEAAKLAFADRERFYGDPGFVQVPLESLLSEDYNRARARLIGPAAATVVEPGSFDELGPAAPPVEEERDPDRILARRSGEQPGATVSIAAVDREGNMIAAVPSGGTMFESPLVEELGLCLGARASGFRLSPESPNVIMPGKRPRTTLSPTMVMRDGEPYLAFCTPGADQQEQWQIAFFLRHIHHAMNLQEAAEAPMFQSEHFPSSFPPFRSLPNRLVIEPRFSAEICDGLVQRGHTLISTRRDWFLGSLTAVARDGRTIKAAACPRHMRVYAVGR